MRETENPSWVFARGQLLLDNPISGGFPGVPGAVANICKLYDYTKIHRIVVVYRPKFSARSVLPSNPQLAWWLPPIYYRIDKDNSSLPINEDDIIRDPKHKVINQCYGKAFKFSIIPTWSFEMAATPLGGPPTIGGIEPTNKRWVNSQLIDSLTIYGAKFWSDEQQPGTAPMIYNVSYRWYFECKGPVEAPL